ncbi:VWA domain-containing protein [Dyadobacter sp. Leaf189]|uniref:VWA domain-containing protein n=1 Tax=Dyadobacter sp. Leaf189 TaxID=1736295 RepID=UPI0006F82578|nr:VWA domain-containing protein [Dyadobacter sp. Leaf189]KQS27951.1 hypothetical protein ASG33_16250 [Dyadobacter sp. Leaf189]
MKHLLKLAIFFYLSTFRAFCQEAPRSLNAYIELMSQSADVVSSRFEMLNRYHEEIDSYKKRPGMSLRLPSSGPLETYYYKKAKEPRSLTPAERQLLNAAADSLWQLVNELDETAKSLETYVRLDAYKDDNFKQSAEIVAKMHALFRSFQRQRTGFYRQLRKVYQRYQPYHAADPYLSTEREMELAIATQQTLLDSLPFYADKSTRAPWPVETVQRSMLADQRLLNAFGKSQAGLAYPASDMVGNLKESLIAMQQIKRDAIDSYNHASKQSAEHGNAVYLSLWKRFNQDMLVTQKAFVDYSRQQKGLLYYPSYSVAVAEQPQQEQQQSSATKPFEDITVPGLTVKKTSTPAPPATIRTLNGFVELINELLRQMHLMQLLVRNYQSTAEYYRAPVKVVKRADLTYSHEDFKLPLSAYQLLVNAATTLPPAYRTPVYAQADVLINVMKEMDALSIELTGYTSEKKYLKDQLRRSDEILDRYTVLFEIFDTKKEQLYNDVRKIHESYPNAAAATSWNTSGNALLKTLDDDKALLFGIRAFYQGDQTSVPSTSSLESGAKQLIEDEYKNMKGLQRYGRNNGLCPYTPYEDLAGNSLRFVEKAAKIKPVAPGTSNHPYESFYYFYNGELVYLYNQFVELANSGLLKAINQPDLFAFRRVAADRGSVAKKAETLPAETQQAREPEHTATTQQAASTGSSGIKTPGRDTVYVERVRVDTVYVDRNAGQQNVARTLDGFAPNNMILLLDVSSSMNSPLKMPLLKRSIKSLLTLLRPEDQLSIVLYSGKARVVLKPTSGAKANEIARMIDLLQSDGDTDGNEGLRLAYKTANKSYIRGGNNRIVLATDGEFPVSDEVMSMIGQHAKQDLYLTVLTFGRNAHTGQKLRKLSELGQGTYAHVTEESADLQLIIEAQARKLSGK